mmetsp:Transcript_9389/g.20877  ORF Transcript_9389/g.20877 Transcript_9389/m.20877 type:complete len:84 (-) Transcript_9389:1743-1994(-)
MLAHRLIAAVEIRNKGYSDGREVDMDFEERGKDILNKMLTTLTQSLGLLLPSSIVKAAIEKFRIEEFRYEVTGDLFTVKLSVK